MRQGHRPALGTAAALALGACLAAIGTSAHAEPADLPALTCTAVRHEIDGGMRLQIRFDNLGPAAIELPPGPHLVLYADPAATDALVSIARMDRVQRTAITVAPQASRTELFALSATATEALRCQAGKPAAAAVYFYRFTQRPQSRCLLRGLDLDALRAAAPCPDGARR
jgi:hypothetical protein